MFAKENHYWPGEGSMGAQRRNIGAATTKHGNNIDNIILDTYCKGMYSTANVSLQRIP